MRYGLMRRIARLLRSGVVLGALGAALLGGPALADGRPVVVELYTAQGCPLCPTADAYLADLAGRDDVVALSFHVNLWDFIGWQDPFASDATTRRQAVYAEKMGVSFVYTPQMVIDGVLQGSGNDRAQVDGMINSATAVHKPWIDVGLEQVAHRRVRVLLPASEYGGEAEVVLLRLDARHETEILKGENRGRNAVNVNVVRQMKPVTTWQGDPVSLVIPLEDLGGGIGDDYAAIIVQEPDQGRILGVQILTLNIN